MRPKAQNLHAGGSALILVLWIIAILSMIVVSFSFEAHLEGKIVSATRKRIKAESLALSGFDIARSCLERSRTITGTESDDEKEMDFQYGKANDLRLGKSTTLTRSVQSPGGTEEGEIRVDIEPEDSLRNVNKLSEEDWERILSMIGVPEEFWPEMIDSFFDWTDSDSIPRENGAESEDHYERLEPPYSAANAPVKTVGELRYVKGFHPAVLNGGILNPGDPPESRVVISNGLMRILTTYGEGKVNINAVRNDAFGRLLLQTLPGVDEIVAGAIFEEREHSAYATNTEDEEIAAFRDIADAQKRLASIVDDNEFFNSICTSSEIFRISAEGRIGRISKRIEAIVSFSEDDWRILRWSEDAN